MEQKFSLVDYLKNRISNFKFYDYVAVLGLIIFTISIIVTLIQFLNYIQSANESWKIFFGIIDRFTYQSNWMLFVFMLFYVFNPKCFIFKNNYLLLWIMTYITFTFFGYNVVLVGIAKSHSYLDDQGFDLFNNIWLHAICPIYFVLFGIIYMFFNKDMQPKSFVKTLLYGMIYPTLYCVYIIIIPFAFSDYRINGANYGNPNNDPYSVYDFATNTYSNPTSWAYIISMICGFFPLVLFLYYLIWKHIAKLNICKKRSE